MKGDVTEVPEIDFKALETLMSKPIQTVLTLRDHFALAALAGMLQNPHSWAADTEDEYAKFAYEFADAMVKARGVGG